MSLTEDEKERLKQHRELVGRTGQDTRSVDIEVPSDSEMWELYAQAIWKRTQSSEAHHVKAKNEMQPICSKSIDENVRYDERMYSPLGSDWCLECKRKVARALESPITNICLADETDGYGGD